jgi:N-acetylglutamate synthase-like GNAT family acetyltransferase
MPLRKAQIDDIPALLRLVDKHPDQLLSRTENEFRELIPTTWVVEEDARIIGCATLEVYSPKIAEVRTVAVLEEYRGRGFGTELVLAAVEEARRRNIREIMVVTSSPEFFKGIGFGACLNEKYALFMDGK